MNVARSCIGPLIRPLRRPTHQTSQTAAFGSLPLPGGTLRVLSFGARTHRAPPGNELLCIERVSMAVQAKSQIPEALPNC